MARHFASFVMDEPYRWRRRGIELNPVRGGLVVRQAIIAEQLRAHLKGKDDALSRAVAGDDGQVASTLTSAVSEEQLDNFANMSEPAAFWGTMLFSGGWRRNLAACCAAKNRALNGRRQNSCVWRPRNSPRNSAGTRAEG